MPRSRDRGRRLGVAIALVAVTAVAGAVLVQRWDRPSPAADRPTTPATARPTSTAPYEVAPCPDPLPPYGDQNRRLPDLDRVAAVRLCLDVVERAKVSSRDIDQGAIDAVVDPEALVTHLPDFAERVARMREGPPRLCASVLIGPGPALVFTLEDRSRVVVPAVMCTSLTAGARELDAGKVHAAFMEALDRQRSEFSYTREVTAPPSCRTFGLSAPVQPGRERLVSAVRCAKYPDTTPTTIDGQRLRVLSDAWERATTHTGTDRCLHGDDEFPKVAVRTDRGDVLDAFESRCGFLFVRNVAGSWPAEDWLRIPITLSDLD